MAKTETNLEDQFLLFQRYRGLVDRYREFNLRMKGKLDKLLSDSDQEVCAFFLKEGLALVDKSTKGTFMVMDRQGQLTWAASVGHSSEALNLETQQFYENIRWLISRTFSQEILKIDDMDDLSEIIPILKSSKIDVSFLKSAVAIPIKMGELSGFINLEGAQKHAFDEMDIDILNLFQMSVTWFFELRIAKLENEKLTKMDVLTGGFKRCFFEKMVLESQYGECAYRIWLVELLQLDKINRVYGWQAGDLLLVALSKKIFEWHTEIRMVRYSADQLFVFLSEEIPVDEMHVDQMLYQFYTEGIDTGECQLHAAAISVSNVISLARDEYTKEIGVLKTRLVEKKNGIANGLPVFHD